MANRILLNKIGITGLNNSNQDDNYTILLNETNKNLDKLENLLLHFIDRYNTMLQQKFPDNFNDYKIIPQDADNVFNLDVWQTQNILLTGRLDDLEFRVDKLENKIYKWKVPVYAGGRNNSVGEGFIINNILPGEAEANTPLSLMVKTNLFQYTALRATSEFINIPLGPWCGNGHFAYNGNNYLEITSV